jgi:hypothetical protein
MFVLNKDTTADYCDSDRHFDDILPIEEGAKYAVGVATY